MGKVTGFLEWPRLPAPKRGETERTADFRELSLPLAPDEARRQAGRCMDCGVPFCQQGCPLGNAIPDFNDAVWRGDWREAYLRLRGTNPFPELTGRLCPAPCEAACVLAIDGAPVTIEQLEKEIAERAFAEGWVRPRALAPRTGRRVAIVGSGPAGLAAASQLVQAGHEVIVFERDERPGGLLRFGIPDFKLERAVLDRGLAVLEAEGVIFRCGEDPLRDLDRLRAEHDAVLLAVGARVARELEVPGRELEGVVMAMEYLGQQNRALASGAPLPARLDARGKRVVILGGGDTGSDCLGTALRQGAAHVIQAELLPAPPPLRAPENPWPLWPVVFRTSSSQEEGGERRFALRTTHLSGEGGRLRALHAVDVRREGTRLADVPGSERELPVDLLLIAMGFTGPDLAAELGLARTPRGTVAVDASFATSLPGVFCAGDASRGASLIVWALADGREAARGVDAFLTGRPSLLPDRGQDAAPGP